MENNQQSQPADAEDLTQENHEKQGFKNRSLIPASFGIALFCFLLPFLDLKCGGQKIATFSGVDLVMGKKAAQSDMMEQMPATSGGGSTQLFAILTAFTCLIGLITFLQKSKEEYSIGQGTSIAGVSFLLLMMILAKQSIENESQGAVTVEFLIGYWGCLVAITTAGILCYEAIQKGKNSLI